MNHISSKKITNFFIKKLTQIGVEPIVAEATSNALVEASLFGIDSHGVNLFQHYCEAVNGGRISKNKDINFNRNGAIIICDAKNVFAHYAALELLSEMHEVSKEYGVSIGTIRSSDHIGAVGIHSINSKIKNMITLSFTNADALAATPDGKSVVFGTNPISLTFSGDKSFTYIDLATTRFSMNRVKNHRRVDEELPANAARDKKFFPTQNPFEASFLNPIGNHKGFALAFLVEILTSGISSQNHSKEIIPMYGTDLSEQRNISHTFMMIDPKKFGDQTISSINNIIRITDESVTREQSSNLPGNKELRIKNDRLVNGIPVLDEILSGWVELGFNND